MLLPLGANLTAAAAWRYVHVGFSFKIERPDWTGADFEACDPADGSAGNGLRLDGVVSEYFNYLRVRNLGKIGIEKPDCAEILVIFQAYDVVGFVAQFP